MAKFIHVDFVLDLTSYSISRVQENQWFSDQFFTRYTFPFDIDLDDDTNREFGLIMDYTVDEPLTFFEGYFFDDGKHYSAEMEILEVKGRRANLEISYGFNELPNFERKLSELPLEISRLDESLFLHAEDVIDKTWPAVNYNFVQVHTDSFNPDDEEWNGFQKIINNRKNGAFLVNEFDDVDNVIYNRNIMMPMPYFMHVLTTGFEDAGFDLKGDILTDPDLKKMLFFKETEEYVSARIEGAELVKDTSQYDSTFNKTYKFGFLNTRSLTTRLGNYRFEYSFPKRGRYKVAGNVYLRRSDSDAGLRIDFRNQTVYHVYNELIRHEGGVIETIRTVDLYVDVTSVNQKLVIVSEQITYGRPIDVQVDDSPWWI